MKNRRTIILTTVLTALLICMNTSFVSAASLSEIREQIKDKEAELKEGQSKESSLSTQMLELEEKIQTMQGSIDQLDSAIAEGEDQLKTLEAELKKAEEKLRFRMIIWAADSEICIRTDLWDFSMYCWILAAFRNS